jgi:hypothetical protein
MPPLSVTIDEIDIIFDVTFASIDAVTRDL